MNPIVQVVEIWPF